MNQKILGYLINQAKFIWILNILIFISGLILLHVNSPFTICLSLVIFVSLIGIWSHFIGRLWLMYTLIIIFLGGIIIVFIYTASVNNRFKFLINTYRVTFASLLVGFGFFTRLNSSRHHSNLQEGVWRIFRAVSVRLVVFLGLMIIMTLFTVVKLVQIDQGPLKT